MVWGHRGIKKGAGGAGDLHCADPPSVAVCKSHSWATLVNLMKYHIAPRTAAITGNVTIYVRVLLWKMRFVMSNFETIRPCRLFWTGLDAALSITDVECVA